MTQSNADLVELAKVEATPSGVAAAALGNMFAGVGVAFVVGVVLHVVGLSVEQTFKWAALSGLAAWGLIMALWFSLDEVRNWWNMHQLVNKLADARATIDEADDYIAREAERTSKEIAYWKRQADDAMRENATLRFQADARKKHYVAAEDPTDRTIDDARKMIEHQHETGTHPSKRKTAQLWGWSEARHAQALSRLAARGIVRQAGNSCDWLQTGDDALRALALPLALASDQPDQSSWLGGDATPRHETAGEEG